MPNILSSVTVQHKPKEQSEEELNRLITNYIQAPVQSYKQAAPEMHAIKNNGSVILEDYKQTIKESLG